MAKRISRSSDLAPPRASKTVEQTITEQARALRSDEDTLVTKSYSLHRTQRQAIEHASLHLSNRWNTRVTKTHVVRAVIADALVSAPKITQAIQATAAAVRTPDDPVTVNAFSLSKRMIEELEQYARRLSVTREKKVYASQALRELIYCAEANDFKSIDRPTPRSR